MDKLAMPNFADLLKQRETPQVSGQEYLLGLRGLLVIETFLWTFLTVFAPNTVKDAAISNDNILWQSILRKTLSVLFWNKTLIYSFVIVLSARTVAIPFFNDPKKGIVASAVFRRGIRLALPVAVSLAIITIAFNMLGVDYINDFKSATGNIAIATPLILRNAFIYFNSVYQLFWNTRLFYHQSGNFAFPSNTLCYVNLVYQQSYTVFIIMVIAPYTRAEWRAKMVVPFLITAWWVQSWSWYTVTGLFMADLVMHMDFKARAQRGIPLPFTNNVRLPSWIPALVLMLGGLLMQYLWTAWRPDMLNDEIGVHTGLDYGGELNADVDPLSPEARDDNWLFITGFFILFETYDFIQSVFNNRLFVHLGKRSLSWFLTQSWIIYIIGIKLFTHLTQGTGASIDAANVACFVVTLATTIVVGEGFHRLVDYPSEMFSRYAFDWMCKE